MQEMLRQLHRILDEFPDHVVLQRLADTIDTAYMKEQVRLLGQEADLPHLIEHWHAISAEFFH